MKSWKILLTLTVVLAALSAAAYVYTKQEVSASADGVRFDWPLIRRTFLDEGNFKSYEEFARQAADENPTVQHVGAHIFGTALYRIQGMEAIAVCDDRFLYGCFHAVLMAAISAKGLEGIGELRKVCDTVRPDFKVQCEHGIGHGIIGMLGYEAAEISQSLNLCDLHLPDSHPINGCKGGVFMENVQRLMHDGTMNPREFHETEKWEPCNSLDANHLDSCAFWQPMWWVSSISIPADTVEFARQMGTWCRVAPGGASAEKFCVAGIGNIAHSLVGTDTKRTAEICAAATERSDFRYQCQVTTARRLLYSVSRDIALQACDGLPSEESAQCRTDALLTTDKLAPAR